MRDPQQARASGRDDYSRCAETCIPRQNGKADDAARGFPEREQEDARQIRARRCRGGYRAALGTLREISRRVPRPQPRL